MPSIRRIATKFVGVELIQTQQTQGVQLTFRPERARLDVDRIEDYAELGPALTIPAVSGVGKVMRIVRAARLPTPNDSLSWVGCAPEVAALLERAIGTRLMLEVRPRTRISFVAWTEAGVETVEDVADVHEAEDAFLVTPRRGRFPLRFARDAIVRGQTQRTRWYEILQIERA